MPQTMHTDSVCFCLDVKTRRRRFSLGNIHAIAACPLFSALQLALTLFPPFFFFLFSLYSATERRKRSNSSLRSSSTKCHSWSEASSTRAIVSRTRKVVASTLYHASLHSSLEAELLTRRHEAQWGRSVCLA